MSSPTVTLLGREYFLIRRDDGPGFLTTTWRQRWMLGADQPSPWSDPNRDIEQDMADTLGIPKEDFRRWWARLGAAE